MGHKIAEAIIENGKITYVDHKLPSGKVKAHLIYDTGDESVVTARALMLLRETSGIYKYIQPDCESHKLRSQWDRNA